VPHAADGADRRDRGGGDRPGAWAGLDHHVRPGDVPGGGGLTAGDALADHPGEGGQAEREHERERGQRPGQRGPGRPGQRDEAGGARPAGEQRQQPADDQRIEPQHDHDDRDGDQDRHDGEVQVNSAAGRHALVVQDDQAGH
jgi:hypothetical protein